MSYRAMFAAAAALLLLTADSASATIGGLCCACRPGAPPATGSGPPVSPAYDALFCSEIPTVELGDETARCTALGGTIECTAQQPDLTCVALLEGNGVVCPTRGAPVAGPLGLGALVAALVGFGAVAARRRRAA